MSLVDLSTYKISEASTEPITQIQYNLLIDAVEAYLNNITNDQISDNEIALEKVEGGAVPESDVSAAGAVGKIVKSDASGNIVITGTVKAVL